MTNHRQIFTSDLASRFQKLLVWLFYRERAAFKFWDDVFSRESLSSFMWGIFFKKYVTFARRANKSIWWLIIYGHLIWKSYHCFTNFDDCGIFAPTMLSFQRNAILFNVLEPTIKRCWENWLEDAHSWVRFEVRKLF